MIGLFPDLLSKKMQDKQVYPPEIVEARKYLTTKDIETGWVMVVPFVPGSYAVCFK